MSKARKETWKTTNPESVILLQHTTVRGTNVFELSFSCYLFELQILQLILKRLDTVPGR